MFSTTVQPSTISLFSSTSTRPLDLFSTCTDAALPADSVIHLLVDATSHPVAPPPAALISPPALDPRRDGDGDGGTDDAGTDARGHSLCQTVLHMQSPTLRTTYIRCPPAASTHGAGAGALRELGITLPWLHMQVRSLGRAWAFEAGVVDTAGRAGVIRCSTFQKHPALTLSPQPLLHLPLAFPAASSHPLTAWATVSLDLSALMPYFTSLSPSDDPADGRGTAALPSGRFSRVSYLKVYSSCRLRRIWFSEGWRAEQLPWEFQLYAS